MRPVLLAVLPPLLPACAALGCLEPPHLPRGVLLGTTLAVQALVYVLALHGLAGASPRGRVRGLVAGTATTFAALLGYLILFFAFTYPVPDHCHREVGGWSLSERALEYLQIKPGISRAELLLDHRPDELDTLFTPLSLTTVRVALVALWLLLAAGAALAVAVVASEPGRPPEVPRGLPELRAELQEMQRRLEVLAQDLEALESLLALDVPSALNKVRYVAEKVLHGLCVSAGVSWGNAEPTLERMLGPLVASGVIPKNVAIHLRTIQANASPGSHFQEASLSRSHALIAMQALLEFLAWYADRRLPA